MDRAATVTAKERSRGERVETEGGADGWSVLAGGRGVV